MKSKKFLAIAGILSLAIMSLSLAAIGATEAGVTATVTPGTISVTLSTGSVAYGTVGVPSVDNVPTPDTIIGANNSGGIPENFQIKGADATPGGGGSTTWKITTGAVSGTSDYYYNHKFIDCGSSSTCASPVAVNTMDKSYESLATNVPATGSDNRYFKLRLSTPTETGGDTTEHSTTATILATAY